MNLEKEPYKSLKALHREIEVFVGEVPYFVQKAEQTALTGGFYGQPPRITIVDESRKFQGAKCIHGYL